MVNDKGKTATAQDFRRCFGTRWTARLAPAELKELMRHKTIETTMKYYVHFDAESLGAKLAYHAQNDPGGALKTTDSNQVSKDRVTTDGSVT